MKYQEMNLDSAKLKSLRNAKGWTQQHLADVSGISLRTIQRAELKGTVSTETISALNAVFGMTHLEWLKTTETEHETKLIIRRGWKIALISIAFTQVAAFLIVWLLVGEINTLWIKITAVFWVLMLMVFSLMATLFKVQKINSYSELTDLKNKFKPPKTK